MVVCLGRIVVVRPGCVLIVKADVSALTSRVPSIALIGVFETTAGSGGT